MGLGCHGVALFRLRDRFFVELDRRIQIADRLFRVDGLFQQFRRRLGKRHVRRQRRGDTYHDQHAETQSFAAHDSTSIGLIVLGGASPCAPPFRPRLWHPGITDLLPPRPECVLFWCQRAARAPPEREREKARIELFSRAGKSIVGCQLDQTRLRRLPFDPDGTVGRLSQTRYFGRSEVRCWLRLKIRQNRKHDAGNGGGWRRLQASAGQGSRCQGSMMVVAHSGSSPTMDRTLSRVAVPSGRRRMS